MVKFDDAEGDADEVELEPFAQDALQVVAGDAKALDVEVLGLQAQQLVADAAADQEGAAARPLYQLRNDLDFVRHVTCGP